MNHHLLIPAALLLLVTVAAVTVALPASGPATPGPPLTTLPLVPQVAAHHPDSATYWPLLFSPGTPASHALALPAPLVGPASPAHPRHLHIWLRADCLARPRLALGTDATHARLIPYATPLPCSNTDKVEVVEYRVPLTRDQPWSQVAVGVDPHGDLVGKPITAWIRAAVVDGPSPDPALQLTGPSSPTLLAATTACTHAGLRLAVLSSLRPVNLARAHAGVLHATGAHGRVWVGGWQDAGLGVKPVQVLRAGDGKAMGANGLAGMAVLDYPENAIAKDGLYALCQTY